VERDRQELVDFVKKAAVCLFSDIQKKNDLCDLIVKKYVFFMFFTTF